MKYIKSLLCLMLITVVLTLSGCSSIQTSNTQKNDSHENNNAVQDTDKDDSNDLPKDNENTEENKTDNQNNVAQPSEDDPWDPGPPSGEEFYSVDEFFAFHDEITTLEEDEIFDFCMSHDMFEYDIDDYCDLTENIVIPFKSSQNDEMNLIVMDARRWDTKLIDPCINVDYKDADFLYMFHVFAKDKYILDKSQKFVENFKDSDSIITCEIGAYTFQLKLMEIHLGYLFLEDHIIEIRVRNDSGTDKEISFEDFDLYTLDELRENFATK